MFFLYLKILPVCNRRHKCRGSPAVAASPPAAPLWQPTAGRSGRSRTGTRRGLCARPAPLRPGVLEEVLREGTREGMVLLGLKVN